MICPRCGSEMHADARFCSACGSPMNKAGVAEERKVVSVLFVDAVGSTERADGADPEDVRALNQLYYAEVSRRIERFGGVVEKYVGDAVMALFGAPVSHSDDAERAVRASLSVLEGIDDLNHRHEGLNLRVRAAVSTGEAMVAVDAAPSDALATGDVVNTAARLQSAAPPGRAVVGAETYRLTNHAFRFERLDAMQAKGKRDPLEAWLVEETVVSPAERPASATPFVGRGRELLLIDSIWERAAGEGAPHLVSVIGPAGIGKSRLGQEFADRVEREGALALVGRSLPYEEQTPYLAFGQIVRRAATIYENDDPEEARRKLTLFVQGLFPEAEARDAVRYLSLVLGLGSGESVDDPILLRYASRRVVELIAERGPLLLVFEDIHWADEALLDLVDYLVTHVRDHPVVFLVLARPEFLESRTGFGSGMVGQTTLHLEPLTPDESQRVVAGLVAEADPAMVTAVVERAEGNPLFLEELSASLADTRVSDELPGTVRAAIAARIDALPSDARTTLLHASVVGLTFWRSVVAAVGALEHVDVSLEALETRGLVRRSAISQVHGDVEFTFKHALVHEVAYATMPKAVRRELHATIAELIESSVSDPTGLAWILAYHYREGGRPERAVEYLVAAGDRARAALALEETYDLYTRAVELAPGAEERRHIRLRRAFALDEMWDHPRADRELAELIPELDGTDEIEAVIARSRANLWTENEELARELSERAVELARERGVAELEAVALGRLGCAWGMSGGKGDIDHAIELQEQAIGSWVPGARPVDLAEVLHLTGDSHYWRGNYARALEHFQASESLGGGDPRSAESLLRGIGGRAFALAGLGRYEESMEASEAAIAAARRLGRSDSGVVNYSTLALRDIYWLDEAGERSRMVADRLGPSSFNMPWMNARADVLCADLLSGDFAAIDRDWPSAWDDALTCHAWERWLISGRLAWVRAESERLRGRGDDAVIWAERALEMALESGRRKYEVASRTTLGAELVEQGDRLEGLPQLKLAVDGADELGSPLLRWRTRAACGRAELLDARTAEGGEVRLREAVDIIRDVAASLTAERGARYLAAPEVTAVFDEAR